MPFSILACPLWLVLGEVSVAESRIALLCTIVVEDRLEHVWEGQSLIQPPHLFVHCS